MDNYHISVILLLVGPGSIVDYPNPSQTNGGKREESEVADPRTWNVSRRYLGRGGGQITQGDPKSPPMTLLELSSRKKRRSGIFVHLVCKETGVR